MFKIILNILIIAYFQPSVGLIIQETTLSLNSKQDDKIEINWILIKQSLEFFRCDNKVSCGSSRRNGVLSSSLEKNVSLIEEKLGHSNEK